MSYNPHDHFEFRKIVNAPADGFGGYHEPDGEYDFDDEDYDDLDEEEENR